MVEKELTSKEDQNYKPLLPAEKTYGEKWHHFIFDTMINFWSTLAISGLFVFWLKHSKVPMPEKILGIQLPEWAAGKLPISVHQKLREIFISTPFAKAFGEANKERVGGVMADALSINLPGTVTILPSLWISAKVKTNMVESLDRKHYGKDCEKDPRIAERHHIIETERKPTLIGAILARAGTMVLSTAAGWGVGAEKEKNFISVFGGKIPGTAGTKLAEFKGVDHYAGVMGDAVGGFLAKESTSLDTAVNKAYKKWWDVGWAPEQAAHFDTTQPYNRALQDWAKWTSLDIMYTMITSTSIHYVKMLLDHVPFMSYKEKPQKHVVWYETPAKNPEMHRLVYQKHMPQEPAAPVAPAPAPTATAPTEPTPTGAAANQPKTQINDAQLYAPVTQSPVLDAGV